MKYKGQNNQNRVLGQMRRLLNRDYTGVVFLVCSSYTDPVARPRSPKVQNGKNPSASRESIHTMEQYGNAIILMHTSDIQSKSKKINTYITRYVYVAVRKVLQCRGL